MDVAHVLHTVDGFLQRDNDRLLHRFGIGTGIRSRYLHRGRRNVWILLHRQPRQGYDAQQNNNYGNNDGKDRAVYKES